MMLRRPSHTHCASSSLPNGLQGELTPVESERIGKGLGRQNGFGVPGPHAARSGAGIFAGGKAGGVSGDAAGVGSADAGGAGSADGAGVGSVDPIHNSSSFAVVPGPTSGN